ncbi:MAG: YceI family protein [Bacteroidia bacterium]|nr:YceI family protein [Bacteroidia bacterium]MBT8269170.1 YceI family protein [Bacteroidia bacterium]NNF82255.1 YceI family protein [Flavobacteriaceae bacterium]NNK70302.1 YceI family protein [Flavobacteriaceae bacterium]NNL79211.1 YceI family protein [Flavobacteriaceae bacterium]
MKILILSVIALITFQSELIAQTYKIDTGHSSVQINIERFGVIDVVGRFKDVQGSITYNTENPSGTIANSVIKVDSYDANNIGGEEAVKSPAFLDAAKFAEITFQSKATKEEEGQMYLIGDLTIHGVTNEIALPFAIKGPLIDLPTQKMSIAFSAKTTINRQDYGVSFNRQLPNGTKIVGDEVDITLTVLAIEEK